MLGDGGVREVVEPQAGAGQGVRQGAQGLDQGFDGLHQCLGVISVVGHRVEEAVGGGPLQVPGLDHVPCGLQILGNGVEVLLVLEHLSAQSARNTRAQQGPDSYPVGHFNHRPISCSHPSRY